MVFAVAVSVSVTFALAPAANVPLVGETVSQLLLDLDSVQVSGVLPLLVSV